MTHKNIGTPGAASTSAQVAKIKTNLTSANAEAESKRPSVDGKGPKHLASILLDPGIGAGATLGCILNVKSYKGEGDVLGALFDVMREKIEAAETGDITDVEGILVSQVYLLNTVFNDMMVQAAANLADHPQAHERFMRLAMKAQAQCRVSIEAIAEIKNPTVFTRNANVVNGHQQVNIGGPRARKSNSVDQPLAAIAFSGGTALPRKDKARRAVPIPRDA